MKEDSSLLRATQKHLIRAYFCALICNISFLTATQAADGTQLAAEGLKFFQQKKYPQAFKALSAAEKSRGVDPSLNYYLGVSALYSNNHAVAKRALSRAVVLSTPGNPFHQQALALLKQYYRVQPYTCRATRSARWSKSAMPLKIFVSEGKMLPAKYFKLELDREEITQIGKWAKNPAFASKLQTVPGYLSGYKQAVMAGAQKWNWAVAEGILSYQFVNDSSKADIMVFYYPKGSSISGGHTNSNGSPNEANVMQLEISTAPTSQGQRALIEGVSWIAGHEFGHCWGLDHSNDDDDIMCPAEIAAISLEPGSESCKGTPITENDKQTLRALYAGPAELMRTSVGK